jgi:hypothetical protein
MTANPHPFCRMRGQIRSCPACESVDPKTAPKRKARPQEFFTLADFAGTRAARERAEGGESR